LDDMEEVCRKEINTVRIIKGFPETSNFAPAITENLLSVYSRILEIEEALQFFDEISFSVDRRLCYRANLNLSKPSMNHLARDHFTNNSSRLQ